jgi:Tol biopolymer transport system component
VQLGLLGRQVATAAQPEPLLTPGDVSGNADGPLVFVSRHTGNAEVYIMQPEGTIANLSNHPAQDIDPAWSPDGTRIAFASNRSGHFDIVVMPIDGGAPRNLTNYWDTFVEAHPADDLNPTWSPDGTRVAFESNRGGDGEIHVMDVQGFQQTNLTRHPGYDGDPSWSPDGTRIAFASNRDGAWNIFLMNPDGSDQRNITSNPDDAGAPAWSPDGTQLLFHALTFRPNRTANFEIYRMQVDSTAPTALTDNTVDDLNPAWSSDGTRVLFETMRDGATSIYTMQVDQAPGATPVLLPNQPAMSGEPDYSRVILPSQSPAQSGSGAGASPGQ